ncbi:unnamed protein product, partial [Polarella glacialis]
CATFAKGNCKAIASTYVFKAQFAFNYARAQYIHHWGGGGGGSHYHSANTKQFQKGDKLRGVVARHSRQAAIRNGSDKNKEKQGTRQKLGFA